MKILLYHHKIQAFYLTFLLFLPLVFFIFYSVNFLKIELQSQDKFSLAINQFTIQQSLLNTTPKTSITPQKPSVQSKNIKKFKKKEAIKTQAKITSQPKAKIQTSLELSNNIPSKPMIQSFTYGKDDNPFLKQIKQAIDNAASSSYPRQARKMRMQGQVLIEFLWREDKILDELKIIKSSGYEILDKNALKIIQIASLNFPKYDKNVRIKIPIDYNLKKF